jgi:TPR repeat protein
MMYRLLVLVSLTLFPGIASAGVDLEAAQRAVRLRDYVQAVKIYATLANRGDAEAQYQVGAFYRAGRGVSKDHTQAFRWYSKAAGSGHVNAQYNLGTMFEHGWGTGADPQQAHHWYQRAADAGHRQAQRKLTLLQGETRPDTTAALREAIRQRKKPAINRLLKSADRNAVDRLGRTALFDAVASGRTTAESRH